MEKSVDYRLSITEVRGQEPDVTSKNTDYDEKSKSRKRIRKRKISKRRRLKKKYIAEEKSYDSFIRQCSDISSKIGGRHPLFLCDDKEFNRLRENCIL